MAGKATGLGATIMVDDASGTPRDISNDVTNFSADGNVVAMQDVTGVDKLAMERLALLTDGTSSFNGVVNWDTNKSHDVFKTTAGGVQRTVAITFGAGGGTLTMEMLFSSYSITHGNDGSLTWSVSAVLANGTRPVWS